MSKLSKDWTLGFCQSYQYFMLIHSTCEKLIKCHCTHFNKEPPPSPSQGSDPYSFQEERQFEMEPNWKRLLSEIWIW